MIQLEICLFRVVNETRLGTERYTRTRTKKGRARARAYPHFGQMKENLSKLLLSIKVLTRKYKSRR